MKTLDPTGPGQIQFDYAKISAQINSCCIVEFDATNFVCDDKIGISQQKLETFGMLETLESISVSAKSLTMNKIFLRMHDQFLIYCSNLNSRLCISASV